jgi:hypothetical protein
MGKGNSQKFGQKARGLPGMDSQTRYASFGVPLGREQQVSCLGIPVSSMDCWSLVMEIAWILPCMMQHVSIPLFMMVENERKPGQKAGTSWTMFWLIHHDQRGC